MQILCFSKICFFTLKKKKMDKKFWHIHTNTTEQRKRVPTRHSDRHLLVHEVKARLHKPDQELKGVTSGTARQGAQGASVAVERPTWSGWRSHSELRESVAGCALSCAPIRQ